MARSQFSGRSRHPGITPSARTTSKNSPISIEGNIVELDYRNPHAWLHIHATDVGGKVQKVSAEWASPGRLSQQGINKDTLRPGDRVIITGSPSRDESEYKIHLKGIERRADGWKWVGRGPQRRAADFDSPLAQSLRYSFRARTGSTRAAASAGTRFAANATIRSAPAAAAVGERVESAHAIEERVEHPGHAGGSQRAEGDAGERQPRTLTQNHPHDLRPFGAERHADPDLAGSPAHGVGDDAVKPTAARSSASAPNAPSTIAPMRVGATVVAATCSAVVSSVKRMSGSSVQSACRSIGSAAAAGVAVRTIRGIAARGPGRQMQIGPRLLADRSNLVVACHADDLERRRSRTRRCRAAGQPPSRRASTVARASR